MIAAPDCIADELPHPARRRTATPKIAPRMRTSATARGYSLVTFSVLSGASQGFSSGAPDDAGMTLTTAIIANAILMAGIVAALARFIHLPFRIENQLLKLEHAVYVPGEEEHELSRAA
jgi:hypothetical protein